MIGLTVIFLRDQATNDAFLSSALMISSRVRSGTARKTRSMPASRYWARVALSAGAPNTLIDNVERSRPAADAAWRKRATAFFGSKFGVAIGSQPSQNSTTRFKV